jgi:photosystem II stability/assembly factor-like uncharacterized protein
VSVDFNDPNRQTLLAGGHEQPRTVWKSTNRGQTWVNIGANLPAGTGFSTHPLVINSQVYLVNAAANGGGPGIFRTTNAGASWTKVSSLGPSSAPLVASNGAIYWVADGGLAKSTDGGATWSHVRSGLLNVSPVELPDGSLVAVGPISLLMSSDGSSWKAFGPSFPFVPQSLTYSSGRKAFFISHWDCSDRVLPDAVMQLELT